ncbi:MAG TPA: hypothetical protein VJM08_07335, partial [Anaerolineales bacterium]|nr:hypothetical protein [Anaerolineales bacterium]
FYTEDWDRVYQRFQSILSERPNHKPASEKLAEAERQRNLAKLYAQAEDAYKTENWPAAIRWFDELVQKSADYKDAAELLREARKQKRLKDLYTEAGALHAAQKWHAVLKVFEQIAAIEPTYPDADVLLPSAQKEAAELKRLTDLHDLYSQGVHKMDAGEWYEARSLLEQVHKSETGFLDTERLLRKIENEIIRIEELKKRNNQINILYEQAHGLIRSKSWRLALDKIGEIQKLDDQFVDKDGIFEKAKTELEHEEQEAQKQNQLAALYAEAVRLMKEGKYQEALEKWHEVRSIDSKYPDRQRVQSLARRKLIESGKPSQNKPRLVITKPLWIGIIGVIAIILVTAGVIFSSGANQPAELTSQAQATAQVATIQVVLTQTAIAPNLTQTMAMTNTVPTSTNTPQPSTSVPTEVVRADPLMYDDFNNPAYDGRFNTILWASAGGKIAQENGLLTLELDQIQERDIGLNGNQNKITDPIFVESKVMLDPMSRIDAVIYMGFAGDSEGASNCAIHVTINGKQDVVCWSGYFGIEQRSFVRGITSGTWHILRVELYPDTMTFTYVVDGEKLGSYIPQNPDKLKDLNYYPVLHVNSGTDSEPSVTGYADYVRVGKIEESETKQTAYRWGFEDDSHRWGNFHDIGIPKVLDGYLTFKVTGGGPFLDSPNPLNISASQTPVVTVRMRIKQSQGTVGHIFFKTSQDTSWNPEGVEFPVNNDGAFHSYNVLMTKNPAWKGVITQIRLDPLDDQVTQNIQFEIDYISVHAP